MLAYLAELGLISYTDLTGKAGANHTINGLPIPADYIAATLVFGVLGAVGKDSGARQTVTLVAWAFVIASSYTRLTKTTSSAAAPAPKAATTVA